MRRVLLYQGAFADRPMIWDASTDFLRGAAYAALFRFFDNRDVYVNEDSVTSSLIGMARMGNTDACAALLTWRRTWSELQENFEMIDLEESPDEPVFEEVTIAENGDAE